MNNLNNLNNLVTFCDDTICYAGVYSPNHPKIQPGIVYGLAKGVVDNLPLVLYNPQKTNYAKSFLYWLGHYTTVSGILLFGASIFKCLYLTDHFQNKEKEEERDHKITVDYSMKYYDKFDVIRKLPDAQINQKRKDETDVSTTSMLNQVIDYTGKYGNVMMYYNADKEGFEYFSDDKNIPFSYLETVSRKLCNTFHCTSKIVDRREAHEKNKEAATTNKNSTKQAKQAKSVGKSKANKFIYIGKFSTMNPLQSLRYDEASPSKKSIRSKFSYKEYMESLKYT
jgi:hypothetical protein